VRSQEGQDASECTAVHFHFYLAVDSEASYLPLVEFW
jgi:hypothetical protein